MTHDTKTTCGERRRMGVRTSREPASARTATRTARSHGAKGSRTAGFNALGALNQTEDQIHRAVCDHLRLRASPSVLWLHPPNGEARNRVTGAKLVGMGVLPGAADLLLWHSGNAYALELKREGGRQTESQKAFAARFEAAGGVYAIAYGIDQALAVLSGWGVLKERL